MVTFHQLLQCVQHVPVPQSETGDSDGLDYMSDGPGYSDLHGDQDDSNHEQGSGDDGEMVTPQRPITRPHAWKKVALT